jgi:hypothetical protein
LFYNFFFFFYIFINRERGFQRISELDRKLEAAELKYLESQRRLRQFQTELATPHDDRWDSPKSIQKDKYDDNGEFYSKRVRPSLKQLTPMEADNATRGMNSLLTAEDEMRVAAILAEADDEDANDDGKVQEEVDENHSNKDHVDSTNSRIQVTTVYDVTEREKDIETKLAEMCIPPPMRKLVFNEKRNTFLLVKDNISLSPKDFQKSLSRSNLSSSDINAGSSISGGSSKKNGSFDFIAEMREKRLARAKEKQIDDALSALQHAPMKRSTSQHRSDAPLSIRAIVQPVSRAEIDHLVQLTLEEIAGEEERASEAEIKKLCEEYVELSSASPTAMASSFNRPNNDEDQVITIDKKKSPPNIASNDAAGAPARVIMVRPKKKKPKKEKSNHKLSKLKSSATDPKKQDDQKDAERKSLFGWSINKNTERDAKRGRRRGK